VARFWGRHVVDLLVERGGGDRVRVVRAGERSKTVRRAQVCWEWLAAGGARRDDVVVALGGGVVGDLAGFVAASYMRGVGLWQVPTSLLAQVDSSVGGKNGVNLPAGKNLVGSFYQPDLVLADPDVLESLPDTEYRNGLGEVVKYALLAGEDLFSMLEENAGAIMRREGGMLARVVERCVRHKSAVVEEDEFDRGARAALNLGHTTAHALEKALGFGTIGHGTAVGLGLLVALAVSEQALGTDISVRFRTRRLMQALGLPDVIALPPPDEILFAAEGDKKVTGKGLGFVGITRIGEAVTGLEVPPHELQRALAVISV
jgi:3-dehydroquinate synthase